MAMTLYIKERFISRLYQQIFKPPSPTGLEGISNPKGAADRPFSYTTCSNEIAKQNKRDM
jgi:hypothetical protein